MRFLYYNKNGLEGNKFGLEGNKFGYVYDELDSSQCSEKNSM